MKNLVLILLLLVCAAARGQELAINTTRFIGGDSSCGYTVCKYSISTSDGGILFVGYTDCYAGGADIPANFPDTVGANSGNLVVGKLDTNMSVSWVKVYGGTQYDAGVSAVQTVDGGYAVLGSTYSNDHDVVGNHNYSTGDLWLLRLDSSGVLLWQKCFGSIYDEQAISLALAPDKGFILFGVSNGEGGDVPIHYSGSEFDYDWFIVKTDSAGTKQWAKTIGGTGSEVACGTAVSADNGYYLISSSDSKDDDCSAPAWADGHGTSFDEYIFRLDSVGTILWDSCYGGTKTDIANSAIWCSSDNTLIVNGYTTSSDCLVSGFHGGTAGFSDIWVLKVTKDGALVWQNCLGGLTNDIGTGILQTSFGFLFSGYVDESISQQWILAVDTGGTQLAAHQFGGDDYERSASINKFRSSYIVSGTSSSSNVGFSEGTDWGVHSQSIDDAFISYLDFWPLNVLQTATPQQLTVYPNPAADYVTISNCQQGVIDIFDITGSKVLCSTKCAKELKVKVADWHPGIYFIVLKGEDGSVITNKLIKL